MRFLLLAWLALPLQRRFVCCCLAMPCDCIVLQASRIGAYVEKLARRSGWKWLRCQWAGSEKCTAEGGRCRGCARSGMQLPFLRSHCQLHRQGMAASDLFCLRDYSACPAGVAAFFLHACAACQYCQLLSHFSSGWSLVPGSGGLCKAPTYYDGSCPQVLDLRALAPQVGAPLAR